ncbi:3-beta hydroxysteroid dehydrogenase isomerase family containing [Pyrrhoderma noxium]|uniref:3-beta hydroxysteroid dehydrogenase isomerase family containing n=1 Tax=Pyrrhoderma noxium TaxID=2282107 RepID=A0A286UHM2_9AGAM|nr:3-beta hydroxysteroid dehydrogenase isomerase family containing [Pyrrhoderma noxium]
MRKTSYVITLIAVIISALFNVLSIVRPDWLYAHPPDIFNSKTVIRYGLLERCERQVIDFPGPGQNGRIHYTDYSCRAFPSRKEDRCESDNRYFCTLWWTAGYAAELGVVFGAAALMAVLVGVSTRSRRRRVWRGIAGLQALHASFKIVAFGIITHLYAKSRHPYFEFARPSTAYVLNTLSWIGDILIIFGVVTTGLAADAGHAWAAGNRAYRPIEG